LEYYSQTPNYRANTAAFSFYCHFTDDWTVKLIYCHIIFIYLEGFEMWCWRRLERINWTDNMRKEEELLRVKEQRNILEKTRKRNTNWIGHILRRNCLLQQVNEGNMEGVIEVIGRRRRKLLDDLKERRGYCNR
jgi:hypothetical protein